MGILIRQSVRSTLFIYLGAVIGFVNTTLLYPRFLTESEIGVLNLLVSYAFIFGFFGTFGFTRAINKFFPFFRDKGQNHNGFLFLTIMVGLLGFVVFYLFYIPFGDWLFLRNLDKSPLFTKYLFLIVPLTFIHIYWNLLDAYNMMLYRTIFGISLKEFWQRIIFSIGLIFVILDVIGFNGYVYIYFAGFCITFLLLIVHIAYHKDFNMMPNFRFYTKPLLRKMFSWSAYGFMTGLGSFAALKIDTVMINEFIDDAATGIYVTVFNFTVLILMPNRGMSRIAGTIVSDAFKASDYDKVEDMYKRTCLTQTIMAVFLFLGLATNIDNIFKMLPDSYIAAYWVIIIIGLANVLRMASGISENIIALSNYYRIQTLFMFFYLVSIVVLNYLLIPAYGLNGAAVASALAILIYFFIRYFFLLSKFGFQPYDYKYLVIATIAGGVYYLVSLLPDIEPFYLDIVVKGAVMTLLFSLPLYFFKISEDFNALADSWWQSANEWWRQKKN